MVSSILTRLRHLFMEAIICFESVAQAIMTEQALTQGKFSVRVMPAPAAIQKGCGFCLRFLPEDVEKILSFLAEQGQIITEIYQREETQGSVSYKKFKKEPG